MKSLWVIILFAGATLVAIAQNPEGVGIGPRVGMNLSNIANGKFTSYDAATNNMNVGAVVGMALNIPIGTVMSIQPEFLFAQKGARYTIENNTFPINLKGSYLAFVNNYLEIPVLAKARLGGKFYGLLEGGPYAGVWLNAVKKIKSVVDGNGSNVEKDNYEIRDEYEANLFTGPQKDNRFDAGVAFGAGFGFGAGSSNIEFDLRYNMGFVDRLKYEDGRPDGVDKQMNRNFGISMLYLF